MNEVVFNSSQGSNSLVDSFLNNLSTTSLPNQDEPIPRFDPELEVASSEQRDWQFEQIDELTYKMVNEEDAYVTNRRSASQDVEISREVEHPASDSSASSQSVHLSESTVNPHVALTKIFVSPESINRHLDVFSSATRTIITESVSIIRAQFSEGRTSHTFSFHQSGLQVHFESDGDQLVVRVKGELPLSFSAEELIKYQTQLWGYMQDIFPDREVVVRLEPDQLPDKQERDGSGHQSSQDESARDDREELEEHTA